MTPALSTVLVLAASRCGRVDPATGPRVGRAEVRSDALRTVIADNDACDPRHKAGYSGAAELYHKGSSECVFVPDHAGLNFEHIFSGDAATFGWNIFEPRRAPMRLVRVSERRVELHQDRTEHWPLRSRIAYELDGGGPGNPAWDFVHFQRRHEMGKEFSFRVRLVVRDFRGQEDVIRTYEAWSGEKVDRPEGQAGDTGL
jgi:hypothetical protein